MKSARVVVVHLLAALFVAALPAVALGQDKATAQDVVAKVKQAAAALSKSGDVTQFNKRPSPWIWADTYIFVLDCDKKTTAAHPMRPDLIGSPLASAKDVKGKNLYPNPASFCDDAKKPSGVWIEYSWMKPGDTTPSRKINYNLGAVGTPYVVVAGIFDDTAIADLSKLSTPAQ
jgi:cytochrome c